MLREDGEAEAHELLQALGVGDRYLKVALSLHDQEWLGDLARQYRGIEHEGADKKPLNGGIEQWCKRRRQFCSVDAVPGRQLIDRVIGRVQ